MKGGRSNPRQRRGLVLLAIAALGAVVSFGSVRAYVQDVRTTVGPLAPVLQLAQDVSRYSPLGPDSVRVVMVPSRWLPETVVDDADELTGLVAAADLKAGSYVQADMVGPPPQLRPGQRAVLLAVPGDGVAGDVGAGARIDVLAALDKARTGQASAARVVVNDALVLAVARGEAGADGEQQAGDGTVRMTLALSADETKKLSWAQSFATRISVSLVGPGSSPLPADTKGYSGG